MHIVQIINKGFSYILSKLIQKQSSKKLKFFKKAILFSFVLSSFLTKNNEWIIKTQKLSIKLIYLIEICLENKYYFLLKKLSSILIQIEIIKTLK